MTTGTGTNGWYPDPHARWPLRYWDGADWTDLVATIDAASRLTTGVDIISRGQVPALASVPESDGAAAAARTDETVDVREPAMPRAEERLVAFVEA
ncbi:MAG TPA: DUF2510 domain-containing protein [Acidimicrobiia bacterium]|jgi:hypothetical protein